MRDVRYTVIVSTNDLSAIMKISTPLLIFAGRQAHHRVPLESKVKSVRFDQQRLYRLLSLQTYVYQAKLSEVEFIDTRSWTVKRNHTDRLRDILLHLSLAN